MEQEDFDRQYREEREVLADLEYSDPIIPIDEEEEEIEICTCDISDFPCPMHSVIINDYE